MGSSGPIPQYRECKLLEEHGCLDMSSKQKYCIANSQPVGMPRHLGIGVPSSTGGLNSATLYRSRLGRSLAWLAGMFRGISMALRARATGMSYAAALHAAWEASCSICCSTPVFSWRTSCTRQEHKASQGRQQGRAPLIEKRDARCLPDVQQYQQ